MSLNRQEASPKDGSEGSSKSALPALQLQKSSSPAQVSIVSPFGWCVGHDLPPGSGTCHRATIHATANSKQTCRARSRRIHGRRRSGCRISNDCVAVGTVENSSPNPKRGPRRIQIVDLASSGENGEGRRLERVYAWKWHQLHSYNSLLCCSIWELQLLQKSMSKDLPPLISKSALVLQTNCHRSLLKLLMARCLLIAVLSVVVLQVSPRSL